MKTTISQNHKAPHTYPCLLEHKKLKNVVLFANSKQGTLVHIGDNKGTVARIGHYYTEVNLSNYQTFHGFVSLSNGNGE